MHTESAPFDRWPQNDLELYFMISSTIFGIWSQKMFMGRFLVLVTIPLDWMKLFQIMKQSIDKEMGIYEGTKSKT